MITINEVFQNFKNMIGQEIDEDEIICAFEDFEEAGETEIYFGKSDNVGYDYIAYVNAADSTQFLFCVDKDNILTDVSMG